MTTFLKYFHTFSNNIASSLHIFGLMPKYSANIDKLVQIECNFCFLVRVFNLSRRLVIKTSLENRNTYIGKIVFGFQDNLSFSRLVLKTKRPILKLLMHMVLIALTFFSLGLSCPVQSKSS